MGFGKVAPAPLIWAFAPEVASAEAFTGPLEPPPHAAVRASPATIAIRFLIMSLQRVVRFLPADTKPGRPRHACEGAAVVGPVVHVYKLDSGLQLQPMPVKVVVRAQIPFVVFVAPS